MWYVIPHEVPMDKSVSLEMEKKVQGKVRLRSILWRLLKSVTDLSEVISFIELRHIYDFVLLS